MHIIITHNDADGIISATAAFLKYPEKKFSVYFATPNSLKLALCKAIARHSLKDEIFIFDLSPNEETAKLASLFANITWIDHHIWNYNDVRNINTINKVEYGSAARICAEYFGLEGEIFDLADQIDRNNVKNEEAEYLRDLIDGIKFFYEKRSNLKLKFLASKLAKGIDEIFNEENNKIVEIFRKWVLETSKEIEKEIKIFNNEKTIAILSTNKKIPVRIVLKSLQEMNIKADVIAVLYHHTKGKKIMTKIELRTMTNFDVFSLAQKLRGGGHRYASGATLEGYLKEDDFLKIFH
ncbi:MAG: DHHA1 domain-containing protein [Candidatus Aenigmatarchaeota archaeon]